MKWPGSSGHHQSLFFQVAVLQTVSTWVKWLTSLLCKACISLDKSQPYLSAAGLASSRFKKIYKNLKKKKRSNTGQRSRRRLHPAAGYKPSVERTQISKQELDIILINKQSWQRGKHPSFTLHPLLLHKNLLLFQSVLETAHTCTLKICTTIW